MNYTCPYVRCFILPYIHHFHLFLAISCHIIRYSLPGGPDQKRRFLGYRGFYFSNFYKSMFSIFTYSEYRKLGSKKIRDFQTSVFSIHLYGEYRKHGCLKISGFFKSQFSIFTRQMSENPRFSNIRLFDIHYR